MMLDNYQIRFNQTTLELEFPGIDFESKIEVLRVECDFMYFKVHGGTHWSGRFTPRAYHSPVHYVIQFNNYPDARCKKVFLKQETNQKNWQEVKKDFNRAVWIFSIDKSSEESKKLIEKYNKK